MSEKIIGEVETKIKKRMGICTTPLCNTGVQVQNEKGKNDDICLDWLRLAGHERIVDEITEIIRHYFGYSLEDSEKKDGKYGYKIGHAWPGVFFQLGHTSDVSYWLLDVQGTGCEKLGYRRSLNLLFDAYTLLGVRATRIDVAFDLVGGVDNLLGQAYESCCSGHLRKISIFDKIINNDGKKGLTLYLGSRSSESFQRWYDKGLETGTASAGRWVRVETVFKGYKSNKLGMRIFDETFSGASDILRGQSLTFCDFRVSKYANNRHLDNMERCTWYQKLLDRVGAMDMQKLPGKPKNKNFENRLQWLNGSVYPWLESVACQLEDLGIIVSPGGVLDMLIEGMPHRQIGNKELTPLAVKMIREKVESEGE